MAKVGITKRRGKFRARITVNGKTHSLGTFDTEQDAAMEYDNAARRLRGQATGKLNFPGLKVLRVEGDAVELSLREPIWTSSDGRKTPVSLLANNHLLNIERMLRYKGAQLPDSGDQLHWYTVIHAEVSRRQLAPLPDHPNQDEATVEIPIYFVTRNGRGTYQTGVALVDISVVPLVQKYLWFDHEMRKDGKSHTPVRSSTYEDGLTRNLDSYVTGNIKYPITHINGDPRDCTRKNLKIELPEKDLKVRPDSIRLPATPQGSSAAKEVTNTAKPETIISGKVTTNASKKVKPKSAAKGVIRARLHDGQM